MCAPCRKAAAARHRRNYYARITHDKRHTLAQRRRAAGYGVAHEPYSRTAVFERWNYTCAYCDAPAEHLDHVTPLSKGGEDKESNMLPACAPCNLTKSDRTLAEWAATF